MQLNDMTLYSAHRAMHNLYELPRYKILRIERFYRQVMFERIVDLRKFFPEVGLIFYLNDSNDPVGRINFALESLIGTKAEIPGKQAEHRFSGFVIVFAARDFRIHRQIIFDIPLDQIRGKGFFLARFDLGDPPGKRCI